MSAGRLLSGKHGRGEEYRDTASGRRIEQQRDREDEIAHRHLVAGEGLPALVSEMPYYQSGHLTGWWASNPPALAGEIDLVIWEASVSPTTVQPSSESSSSRTTNACLADALHRHEPHEKLPDMPGDALVVLEVNDVYALTSSVEQRRGKDARHHVAWLKAHHIRLAASDFW